jgi:glycosyltransferase involved in cell wall biosynthesis
MSRRKFLEQALPTWLPVKYFNRIIVVDWGARENLLDLVKLDKRIVVLQVPGKTTFDPGAAWNAGVRYSESEYVFQIDCDIKLTAVEGLVDLLKGITLGEYFNCVHIWHNHDKRPGSYGGTMIYDRICYNAINGFIEEMIGWGVEDTLFIRKIRKRYNDLLLDKNWFEHIKHSAKSRVCNLVLSNEKQYHGGNISWKKARLINYATQPKPKFHCIEYTLSGRKELIV